MIREIVTIDENLCDGCGLCVPACHEGALRIVDGKARLVSDQYCDGLGACLGHCPRGAIRIERREAAEFDEAAVAAHVAPPPPARAPIPPAPHAHGGGCPGSRLAQFDAAPATRRPAQGVSDAPTESELTHWPVQLHLLPPHAPALRGARLLVAADCVPVAYPEFHAKLLRGRSVVVGCPKLDDLQAYLERLTEMFRVAQLREVVVARMEVPCCGGIVAAVVEARRRAGVDTPVTEVVVSTRGALLTERRIPVSAVA